MSYNAKKKKPLPNPLNYSLWLLNYRERSISEMKESLIKKGYEESVIDDTLNTLIRCGYLDNQRFMENYISQKKRTNPKGRMRVAMDLKKAGINCDEELDDLYTDEEEQEIIERLLNQWQNSSKKSLSENRNKYFSRLSGRGFSYRNIREVFDVMIEGEITSDDDFNDSCDFDGYELF